MTNNNSKPVANGNDTAQWKGYTLEQLRFQRALAAIKSEVAKERITVKLAQAKTQASSGNVRSLLFGSEVIGRLKAVDYLLIGYKASKLSYKLWHKFSRRGK